MFKKLYINLLFVFAFLFWSCSDDIQLKKDDEVPEGWLKVNIYIPPQDIIRTRGANEDYENNLTNLMILCYGEDGSLLQQHSTANINDDHNVIFPLDDKLKVYRGEVTVFAIANYPQNDNSYTSTISSLKSKTETGISQESLVMSGKSKLSSTTSSISIEINRVVAKVTLQSEISEESDGYGMFELTGMKLYNVSAAGYITSPISMQENVSYIPNDITLLDKDYVTSGNPLTDYVFPSISSQKDGLEENGYTFMIVQGKYNNDVCYYRLDFRTVTDENGEKTYIPIETLDPNHWYQAKITAVTGKGYVSEEEAIANPNPETIVLTIEDHVPGVLSMVTDGLRELGVTREIVIDRNSSKDGDYYEGWLYIKVYSPFENEESPSNITITGAEQYDWFELDQTVLEAEESEIGISDEEQDKTTGKTYKYKLKFKATPLFANKGILDGKLKIEWEGLERHVVLSYQTDFDPSQIIEWTQLIIHNTDYSDNSDRGKIYISYDYDDNRYENGYWKFLSGNITKANKILRSDQYTQETRLFGIQPEDMGGKVRNNGFHFPVMYGSKRDNPWWYEYKIEFKSNSYKAYKFTIECDDNSGFDTDGIGGEKNHFSSQEEWWKKYLHLYVDKNKNKNPSDEIDLSGVRKTKEENDLLTIWMLRGVFPNGFEGFDSKVQGVPDDYKYGTAKLVMTLYPEYDSSEEKGVSYTFNLYHTGFFHYESNDIIINNHNYGDFTTFKNCFINPSEDNPNFHYYEVVGLDGVYWLDRNLGASKATQFIESAMIGDNNSRGTLFKIASENEPTANPKIDVIHSICPPGYEIPLKFDWQKLYASTNFHNSHSGAFIDADEYSSGRIYFPKSFIKTRDNLNSTWPDNYTGDGLTGYYWTATQSSDVSDKEIGKWLTAFTLSPYNCGFENFQVNKSALLVRPVSRWRKIDEEGGDKENPETHEISFNVKGATHAYFYYYEESQRISDVAWPGKAIGDPSTMTESTKKFTYKTSANIDNLYVIFNFITEDGKIITICSNSDDSSYNLDDPSTAKGWKVTDSDSFSIEIEPDSGNFTITNSDDLQKDSN